MSKRPVVEAVVEVFESRACDIDASSYGTIEFKGGKKIELLDAGPRWLFRYGDAYYEFSVESVLAGLSAYLGLEAREDVEAAIARINERGAKP